MYPDAVTVLNELCRLMANFGSSETNLRVFSLVKNKSVDIWQELLFIKVHLWWDKWHIADKNCA